MRSWQPIAWRRYEYQMQTALFLPGIYFLGLCYSYFNPIYTWYGYGEDVILISQEESTH